MARTKEEMFQFYKEDILTQAKNTRENERFHNGTRPPKTGWTRFCVIQHICSFPDLDPIRMAAEIIQEGIKVYFDNSAITPKENKRLENEVNTFMKGLRE